MEKKKIKTYCRNCKVLVVTEEISVGKFSTDLNIYGEERKKHRSRCNQQTSKERQSDFNYLFNILRNAQPLAMCT